MFGISKIRNTLTCSAVILIAMSSIGGAETKKIEFDGKKPDLIDYLAKYNVASCHSLVTDARVKTSPKNGRLSVQATTQKLDKGRCRGRTIRFFVVVYQPKPGFKGSDEATITYRAPPRRYTENQDTILFTTKYKITVK